jgi:hypothetical protein
VQLSEDRWLSLASAAALALAGTAAAPAAAVTAPTAGEAGVRYLHYQDRQPGNPRITVHGYAANVLAPINDRWVLEAYGVIDAISGASPAYYTAPASLVRLTDRREAVDVRMSHYSGRQRITLGVADSRESDYVSTSVSGLYAASSDDQNTTWTAGVSATRDRIDPVNRRVVGERKRIDEMLLGLTQVLSPRDIVQLQLTHGNGRGYFSDPYKLFDLRPDGRRQTALLLRWNHRLEPLDATLRLSARAYRDSFGVRSATLGAEWAQQLPHGWTLTPGVRLYAQTPARFFAPPDPADPDRPNLPPDYRFGRSLISMDQRLAGLGAATVGVKVEKRLASGASVYFKIDHYEQRTGWDWLGGGGTALRDFQARSLQVGYTYRWNR